MAPFKTIGFGMLFVLVCLAGSAPANDPKTDAPALKKYVGVYTRSQPKTQLILQNPKIRLLANRPFLVGTPVNYLPADEELQPFKNAVRWVAWEEVIEFYEFDNVRGIMRDPQ